MGDITGAVKRTLRQPKPEEEMVLFQVPVLVPTNLWELANNNLSERGRGRGKNGNRSPVARAGHVALDGTKIKANASKHIAMSYKRMKEEEARLEAEVKQLFQKALKNGWSYRHNRVIELSAVSGLLCIPCSPVQKQAD
ncbi:hypothetical protein ACFLYR_08430 [Chloroflexota bacterium]